MLLYSVVNPRPMRTDVEAKLVSRVPNGTLVQVFKQGQGTAWKIDREILQNTDMRGWQEVTSADVCQNLRHNAHLAETVRRVALPQEVWEEVLKAGLSQHPVSRLMDVGKQTLRVVWDTPPSPGQGRDAVVDWHNHLVDLCGIRYVDMRQRLRKTGQGTC